MLTVDYPKLIFTSESLAKQDIYTETNTTKCKTSSTTKSTSFKIRDVNFHTPNKERIFPTSPTNNQKSKTLIPNFRLISSTPGDPYVKFHSPNAAIKKNKTVLVKGKQMCTPTNRLRRVSKKLLFYIKPSEIEQKMSYFNQFCLKAERKMEEVIGKQVEAKKKNIRVRVQSENYVEADESYSNGSELTEDEEMSLEENELYSNFQEKYTITGDLN